jgi:hypothetical protein
MGINSLRWKALGDIGVSYQYIKNYIKNKYNIEISETNINEFSNEVKERYAIIDEDEVLFNLEDSSYRKLAFFSLREKESEELRNGMFRENFLQTNRLKSFVDNEIVSGVDQVLYPCYIKFSDRYVTIKMAQLRSYIYEDFDEDNVVTSTEKTYYHCVKFIVDLYKNILFMFYNDINNETEELNCKSKAITEKKQAFYSLFPEGTQNTLIKLCIDSYLNKYIKDYLNNIECNKEDNNNSVIVIETSDPIESKNNLRSSKKDGRHNEYRLKAIKYALEHEDHNVKVVELKVKGRWFQLKSQGEIITIGPYFNREVVKSVCEEIFPDYKLSENEDASGY